MKKLGILIGLLMSLVFTGCSNLKVDEVLISLDNAKNVRNNYLAELPTTTGKYLYFDNILTIWGTRESNDLNFQLKLRGKVTNTSKEIVKVVVEIPLINRKTGETSYITDVQYFSPKQSIIYDKIFNLGKIEPSKVDSQMSIINVYSSSLLVDSSDPYALRREEDRMLLLERDMKAKKAKKALK